MLTEVSAQDPTNFTQFFVNPYLINPSYAGMDGQSAMSLVYKDQWTKIDGAPTIANFSLHTPVNPKMSTGLSVTNDKRGIFNNSSVLASYVYNLGLKKTNTYFRFGLSLGGTWNGVDQEKVEMVTDPLLGKIVDSHASIAGNAGISYQSSFFQLGVSIPSIFSPSYVSENGFAVKEVKPFESLIFNTTNRFYFGNNKHIFEPHLIYRLNTGLPSQYEAAGIFHFNHVIWVGGTFKQDFGVSAVGGIKLKNMLAIGGAYNFQNAGINELNSPGFEITINYLFGKHKRGVHVYSFVNDMKEKKALRPSASHAIASSHQHKPASKPAAPVKQPAVKTNNPPAKTDPVVNQPKKTEPASDTKPQPKNPPVKEEPAKPPVKEEPVKTQEQPKEQPKPEVKPTTTPVEPARPIQEGHHEHEQEQIKRLEIHAEDPHEHHDGTQEHPHAERHEFVKRGNHHKELPVSDYVVAGVFGKEENAKHFSEGLDKLGYDTHYGHLTVKNLWYVFLIQTEDLDEARAVRDKARKTKMLRDAWLLTVHH